MTMPKITLVTLDYPPERGGVARYLGNLVSAANGEIEVVVNETHATTGPGNVRQAHLLKSGGISWWPSVKFLRLLFPVSYETRKESGLILVSHVLPMGTAAWIARLLGGSKYVVLVHGLDVRLAQTSLRKRWFFKRVLRGAALVVANSEFTAAQVRSADPSIKPQVLTPGVEPMEFPGRDEARQALGISLTQVVLLSVARLVPNKGMDRVIEALSHLPGFVVLAIVGDGEDRERLDRLAEPVKDRVRFVAHATDEERNAWYAAADIFVLPSRDADHGVEGFGIVFLEAGLAGLPVIAGKSGGTSEAVKDGETGILVDPASVEKLAATIERLRSDADLRQRLGQAGRIRAQTEFVWQDRWEMLRGWIDACHPERSHTEPRDPFDPADSKGSLRSSQTPRSGRQKFI